MGPFHPTSFKPGEEPFALILYYNSRYCEKINCNRNKIAENIVSYDNQYGHQNVYGPLGVTKVVKGKIVDIEEEDFDRVYKDYMKKRYY